MYPFILIPHLFQALIETQELMEQQSRKEQFNKDLSSKKAGSDDVKIDRLIAGYLQTRTNDNRKGSISKSIAALAAKQLKSKQSASGSVVSSWLYYFEIRVTSFGKIYFL